MSDLIPFVLKEEQQHVKQEIDSKCVSVIFDGTSQLGKALAVVLRFIGETWTFERLLCVQLLAKSLSRQAIARELISVLPTSYSIDSSRLLTCMRDEAATNGVAVRTLNVLYPKMMDVKCFSHTLDRVGEHFEIPVLREFVSTLISLFSHSPKARLYWKEETGVSMRMYSATRWWSKWEVMRQLMVQFGDVEPFLIKYPDISPATNAKLGAFFNDRMRKVHLYLELACIIDWGEHFVKVTYILEGDGPLSLRCYEVIDMIFAAIRSGHCPNVEAVAKKLVTEVRGLRVQQMKQYAQNAIQPGLDYFKSQIEVTMKKTLSAFKAACLFSPYKVNSMNPVDSDLDSLKGFPFLMRTN